jgi:hypothetical protein
VAGIWVSIVAVLGLAATLLLKEHVASVPTGAAKVAA